MLVPDLVFLSSSTAHYWQLHTRHDSGPFPANSKEIERECHDCGTERETNDTMETFTADGGLGF